MTKMVSAASVMFQPALDPILSEFDFLAHYIILIGLRALYTSSDKALHESKTWFTSTDNIITLQ
jgi:hypothetical protein